MKSKILLTIPLITLSLLSSTQAVLHFYEDFTGFTAGGAGLDGQGGWNSPGDSQNVRSGSTFGGTNGTYNGTISGTTAGGNYLANLTSAPDSEASNTYGNIALSSSVTNSFVAGTTTWFSYAVFNAGGGALARHSLAIGAAPVTGSLGADMVGQGIGVSATNGNAPQATFWNSSKNAASTTTTSGRPYLVIAKIEWSDTGNDVITAKRFLSLPSGFDETAWNAVSGVTTNNADLDQSTFDTLSFGNRTTFLDDIRIASDFDSAVTGTVAVPEPSSLLLSSLGGLALMLRRRR